MLTSTILLDLLVLLCAQNLTNALLVTPPSNLDSHHIPNLLAANNAVRYIDHRLPRPGTESSSQMFRSVEFTIPSTPLEDIKKERKNKPWKAYKERIKRYAKQKFSSTYPEYSTGYTVRIQSYTISGFPNRNQDIYFRAVNSGSTTIPSKECKATFLLTPQGSNTPPPNASPRPFGPDGPRLGNSSQDIYVQRMDECEKCYRGGERDHCRTIVSKCKDYEDNGNKWLSSVHEWYVRDSYAALKEDSALHEMTAHCLGFWRFFFERNSVQSRPMCDLEGTNDDIAIVGLACRTNKELKRSENNYRNGPTPQIKYAAFQNDIHGPGEEQLLDAFDTANPYMYFHEKEKFTENFCTITLDDDMLRGLMRFPKQTAVVRMMRDKPAFLIARGVHQIHLGHVTRVVERFWKDKHKREVKQKPEVVKRRQKNGRYTVIVKTVLKTGR